MKNITQTILLGLALCCLMVSNGFGQITEWQMIRAKYTVMRYCELLTRYANQEDVEAVTELKGLFVNDKVMVYNDLNKDEPYTELRFYLRDIEKKRGKNSKISIAIDIDTVRLQTCKNIEQQIFIKITVATPKLYKNLQEHYQAEFIVSPEDGKIMNILNANAISFDELVSTDIEVMTKLRYNLEERKNIDTVLMIARLTRIAKQNAEANFRLYFLVKTNDERGKYLNRAADKGYPNAQYFVGVANFYGSKVVVDITEKNKQINKGYAMLLKAYEQKDVYAAAGLAEIYLGAGEKYGIKPDTIKALDYLEKGLEFGTWGTLYCGKKLLDYYLAENNDKKAFEVCKKLAPYNNLDAQYWLGHYYYAGKVTEKNVKEAKYWFIQSYQKGVTGVTGAAYVLAFIYFNEDNNKNEAIKWLRISIKIGNEFAVHESKKLLATLLNKKDTINIVNQDIITVPSVNERNYSAEKWEELANNYYQNGYFEEAIQAAKNGLEMQGNNKIDLYHIIAFANYTIQNYSEADIYITKILSLMKTSAYLESKKKYGYSEAQMLYNERSYFLHKSFIISEFDKNIDLGLAKPYYEKYLSITLKLLKQPNNDIMLIKNGMSVVDFKKAARKETKLAHNYLIKYYQKNKQTDKAIFHYEKLLEITPEDQEARQALEALKK
jgi:tetratricopeptide (TPR) repeat protein